MLKNLEYNNYLKTMIANLIDNFLKHDIQY